MTLYYTTMHDQLHAIATEVLGLYLPLRIRWLSIAISSELRYFYGN